MLMRNLATASTFAALLLLSACGGVEPTGPESTEIAALERAPDAVLARDLPGCDCPLPADTELLSHPADAALVVAAVDGEPVCVDTLQQVHQRMAIDTSKLQPTPGLLGPHGLAELSENAPEDDPIPIRPDDGDHESDGEHQADDGTTGPAAGPGVQAQTSVSDDPIPIRDNQPSQLPVVTLIAVTD